MSFPIIVGFPSQKILVQNGHFTCVTFWQLPGESFAVYQNRLAQQNALLEKELRQFELATAQASRNPHNDPSYRWQDRGIDANRQMVKGPGGGVVLESATTTPEELIFELQPKADCKTGFNRRGDWALISPTAVHHSGGEKGRMSQTEPSDHSLMEIIFRPAPVIEKAARIAAGLKQYTQELATIAGIGASAQTAQRRKKAADLLRRILTFWFAGTKSAQAAKTLLVQQAELRGLTRGIRFAGEGVPHATGEHGAADLGSIVGPLLVRYRSIRTFMDDAWAVLDKRGVPEAAVVEMLGQADGKRPTHPPEESSSSSSSGSSPSSSCSSSGSSGSGSSCSSSSSSGPSSSSSSGSSCSSSSGSSSSSSSSGFSSSSSASPSDESEWLSSKRRPTATPKNEGVFPPVSPSDESEWLSSKRRPNAIPKNEGVFPPVAPSASGAPSSRRQ